MNRMLRDPKRLLFAVYCLFLSSFSYGQCPSASFSDSCSVMPKGYVMVQKFDISIKSKKDDKDRIITVTFTKKNTYSITLCNAEEENPLVIFLYDDKDNILAASYAEETDQTFNKISFRCVKSGTYKIAYFFHKRKNKGCGVLSVGIKQIKVKVKA